MLKILNLTQHTSTPEQGVKDLEGQQLEILRTALNFDILPTHEAIRNRAMLIASLAKGYDAAMIGGAPFLMTVLEHELLKLGITPYYAFTQRITEERVDESGAVIKTSFFKHEGFVVAVSAIDKFIDENSVEEDIIVPCYPDDGIYHPIEVM